MMANYSELYDDYDALLENSKLLLDLSFTLSALQAAIGEDDTFWSRALHGPCEIFCETSKKVHQLSDHLFREFLEEKKRQKVQKESGVAYAPTH